MKWRRRQGSPGTREERRARLHHYLLQTGVLLPVADEHAGPVGRHGRRPGRTAFSVAMAIALASDWALERQSLPMSGRERGEGAGSFCPAEPRPKNWGRERECSGDPEGGGGRKKAINVKTRSGKPTAPPSACPAWVGLVQLAHWQTGASLSNLCPLSTHQTKI